MFMDRLIVDCGFTIFFITWKFECWTQTSNAFFSCELGISWQSSGEIRYSA